MLNIYWGDGALDKEKFIFERIDPDRKTILIVPDQFSLQAERDALRLLNRKSLTELMVVDFSALGRKVVAEVSGREPEIIDRYGRHMLLSVLIGEMADELSTYRSMGGGMAFADQMNTMISELKRYEISVDRLQQARDALEEGAEPTGGSEGKPPAESEGEPSAGSSEAARGRKGNAYLTMKLDDILKIYAAYEEAVDGVYQDAEDYITYYAERIPQSELVRGADVWIFGFDSFTPRNLTVIRQLIRTAERVSVMLTCEDGGSPAAGLPRVRSLTLNGGAGLFELSRMVTRRLCDTAEEAGAEWVLHRIETGDGKPREKEAGSGDCLWESGARRETLWNGTPEETASRITLCRTSDQFHEAERAAAFVQELVRDRGMSYGEIAVICNDTDGLGGMVRRALQRMDVPVFSDHRRKVLHQPVVSFLLSFLDVLGRGYAGDGTMGMIKSGLLGWSMEDESLLENYLFEFRVRGSRWKKPFVLGADRYTGEEMARLNEMRAFLVDVCERAKDSIGRRNTAEEKIRGLYGFLRDDFRAEERIAQIIEEQREHGLDEGAAETAQIWNTICDILEQIVRVVGPKRISNRTMEDMIRVGLTSMDIGIVPTSGDCLLMGTLQRTRPGKVRALIVVGANDGILPIQSGEEGLLTRREMEVLDSLDLELARRQKVAAQEEQMAIYRMLALPSEQLFVSCSSSGTEGESLRPSYVFDGLKALAGRVAGDLEDGDFAERIYDRRQAASCLAEAIRRRRNGEQTPPQWRQVARWYARNDLRTLERIESAGSFDNRREALGAELADALYRGDREMLKVSASRLEKFSGCAFAHFVSYGLGAQERRSFEVGGREIGDIYHRCVMEYSRELTEAEQAARTAGVAGDMDVAEVPGGADSPNAGGSPSASVRPGWTAITREQCADMVHRILRGSAESYQEGLFGTDGYSRFRMSRIEEICVDVAWALTEQVRRGTIRQMLFEERFGTGGRLPAVEVELGAGDGASARDGAGAGTDAAGGNDASAGTDASVAGDGGPDAGRRRIRIEGIIDRLDVLGGEGEDPSIRVIDYKTGGNEIDPEEIRKGYQLQLALYMDAVERAGEGEPAGIFYFKIRDIQMNNEGDKIPEAPEPEELNDLLQKEYRLEGIVINDERILGDMDGELRGDGSGTSDIFSVSYDRKKNEYRSNKDISLLERDEFRELLAESKKQVERICREICEGKIRPEPHMEDRKTPSGDNRTACDFCDYRSICMFDRSFPGCHYRT